MRTLLKRNGGFTLIELMIVVAIIGILAAIAIPNFLQFQLRSKTGEAKTNLAAIRTAEEGYFAEFNNYVEELAATPGAANQNKQVWPTGTNFDQLGWQPEGEVFYDYAVTAPAGGASYQAATVGDLDGNGVAVASSDYGYVHPVPGSATGPGAPMGSCAATGVYNPATTNQDLLNTVGPCDQFDGQRDF
jgi:type IV pilus assembly protein PilA